MLAYLIIFAIGIAAGAIYVHRAIEAEQQRHAAALRRIIQQADASAESYHSKL